MMQVFFSPLALRDLEDIGDFIAEDSPLRALSFVAELQDQCHKIAQAPLAYVAREELAPSLRMCAYGRYLILALYVFRGLTALTTGRGKTREPFPVF